MMNKKKQQITALVLLLSISAILTGCNGDPAATGNKPTFYAETNGDSNNIESIIKSATLQYPSSNSEYEYNVYDKYIQITKYMGNSTDINIPSTIDNLPVLVVGDGKEQIIDYSFGKSYSVNISSGIALIENSAFRNNGISSIILPDTLLKIGDYAFQDCNLSSIDLPNSLIKIGRGAFKDSTAKDSSVQVTIPEKVTFIGGSAFYQSMNYDNYIYGKITEVTIYSENVEFELNEEGAVTHNSDCYSVFNDDTIIYGYTGSTSAQYAAKLGNTFKPIE